jgi:hypothetical protein
VPGAEEVEVKGVVAGTGVMTGERLVGRRVGRGTKGAGWGTEEEDASPGQGAEASAICVSIIYLCW